MHRPWAPAACLLLLAGCLTTPSGSFEAVAAPVWQPGYTWTYRSTASFSSMMFGDAIKEPERETGTVEVRVTNATAFVLDEPAYFLSVKGERLEFTPWSGSLLALSRDQLHEVAQGGSSDGWSISYAHDRWHGAYACEPARSVWAGSGAPAMLRFPLAPQDRWSGESTSLMDGLPFRFQAEVVGREAVTVPAGRFDAVHVRLHLQPIVDPLHPEEAFVGGNMRVSVDVWYSAEVAYIVKAASLATVGSLMPLGSFSHRMVTELESYSLEAQAEEPAPVVRTDKVDGTKMLRIVSDDGVAPRITPTGPATLRLSFEEAGMSGKPWGDHVLTKASGSNVSYDRRFYTPVWNLHGPTEAIESVGDTFEASLAEAGRYYVSVGLRARECGASSLGYGSVTVGVGRDYRFHVDPEPGLAGGPLRVGNFTLREHSSIVNLTWARAQDLTQEASLDDLLENPLVEDGGYAHLTGSGGTPKATGSDPLSYKSLARGEWVVEWQPEGPMTPAGRSPLLQGHDHVVGVSVDYPVFPIVRGMPVEIVMTPRP